ncbi:MAG: DUF1461 domain-containing protein [Thiothrix sp.]|nr:DUF1461 domain-containing protein [Thiothrix sp.]HPQ94800.1 DUF1461 domain-containing protein [Thiolinea sp.]
MPATPALSAGLRLLLPVFLLLWLFCLPLAVAVYTPWTYQLYCHWNPRCEQLGPDKTRQSITELNRFFQHRLELLPSPPWSAKEVLHMQEVRGLYDTAFGAFLILGLILALDFFGHPDRRRRYGAHARRAMLLSGGLLVLMLVIAPFFRHFWLEVFHPLLFSNELWRTDPRDISWYLMPRGYFLAVILFLLSGTLLLTALIGWWGYRRPPVPA